MLPGLFTDDRSVLPGIGAVVVHGSPTAFLRELFSQLTGAAGDAFMRTGDGMSAAGALPLLSGCRWRMAGAGGYLAGPGTFIVLRLIFVGWRRNSCRWAVTGAASAAVTAGGCHRPWRQLAGTEYGATLRRWRRNDNGLRSSKSACAIMRCSSVGPVALAALFACWPTTSAVVRLNVSGSVGPICGVIQLHRGSLGRTSDHTQHLAFSLRRVVGSMVLKLGAGDAA